MPYLKIQTNQSFTDNQISEVISAASQLVADKLGKPVGQDVRLELSAVATGGRLDVLRFRAWGCPHVIAAAEAACAGLEGAEIAELLEFSAVDLMENLAVPVEKTGRILVLEDAVRSLGQALRDGT